MAMTSRGGAVPPRDRSAPWRQGVPSDIRQSLPDRSDFGTELASIPAEFPLVATAEIAKTSLDF
jgi:hypothetical protein